MKTKSLVDELSEDKEKDKKIIKSFYSKNTLSPDIFDQTNEHKMIPAVRTGLDSIADEFIEFLGVDFFIHDVVLTGSLANYNWSEFSDLDVHIVIDYEESGHNLSLLKEFFDSKKKVWNDTHNIKIKGYEVELYVQDISEKHISSGVYSILNNKWIIEPQKAKEKIDDRKILEKGEEYAKLIDSLKTPQDANELRKKIKQFRMSGLEKGGEYSYENLTFKLLRRNGYIEKLLKFIRRTSDTKLSITESSDFSYSDVLKLEKGAVEFYGTTDVLRYAGYITPSGYLLDFSEGYGSRSHDHRNILFLFQKLGINMGKYESPEWENSFSKGLYAARDMGFIRYMPESQALDMREMPTQEQFGVIRKIIEKTNGQVMIELGENAFVEYKEDTPAEIILQSIIDYYKYGKIPKPYEMYDEEDFF